MVLIGDGMACSAVGAVEEDDVDVVVVVAADDVSMEGGTDDVSVEGGAADDDDDDADADADADTGADADVVECCAASVSSS